jgi:hypothetical protein
MSRLGWRWIVPVLLVTLGAGTAAAQWAVWDPATTAQNAVTAGLKEQALETLTKQYGILYRMARRLSVATSLDRYTTPDPPRWRIHDAETSHYANRYHAALNYGDATGEGYEAVARSRRSAVQALGAMSAAARDVVLRELATLDAADSAAIVATHQAGALRYNGRREMQAIDVLESQVVDTTSHGTTGVLDKISGATLLETRQKQTRLQLLASIVEQLVVDSKRARDADAVTLNMQLRRLQAYDDEGWGFMAGAADDLRRWRQP